MGCKKPIFVVGSPRSGTSLISRILDSHPNIGVPFESHIYPRLYNWRNCYGDMNEVKNKKRLVRDILSLETLKSWREVPEKKEVISRFRGESFHSAFQATMEAWLASEEKNRWGEKTPHNIFFWESIIEGFPDSKFIHIVRDGRDVALSWKKVRFGPEHFYPIARLWKKYIEKVEELKSNIGRNKIYEVKYEKILTNPKKEIGNVCYFLGEKFYPKMMSFYDEKKSYPTDKRNEENLSRPLLRDNMNKWRTQADPRNLRIFEAVAGGILERYGYELSQQEASISRREAWQIRFVERPVTRLFGVLKDVRGMREAVRSLPLYLRLVTECYLGVNR